MSQQSGTGGGSDVDIHFSMSTWESGTCNNSNSFGAGADEVLLHELVHALRAMRGRWDPVPTTIRSYDNQEEFFAILITNIYMSEKQPDVYLFRSGHRDFSPLDPFQADSEGFLRQPDNLRLVDRLCGQEAPLCQRIRYVTRPTFNPIRELLENRSRYRP
jgi:hypothetical protein